MIRGMEPEPEPEQGPAQKAGEILVFLIRKETKCSECGQELGSGRTVLANTGIIGFPHLLFRFSKARLVFAKARGLRWLQNMYFLACFVFSI